MHHTMEAEIDLLMLANMDSLTREQLQYLEEKYLNRTRKYMPEKLTELSHMHLAFLLDLSGDKLEALLSDDYRLKKKPPVSVFRKKEKSAASSSLFGSPLTDEGVCLMLPLIKYLSQEKNLCFEGLFRISGSRARENSLRSLLEKTGSATTVDPNVYKPADVTGVLKEFLRQLPEPLLTERYMVAFKQIIDLGKHADSPDMLSRYKRKKLSALQLLMMLVPAPVQKLTQPLLILLKRVADCHMTKMSPYALALVMSPIFCVERKSEGQELKEQANAYVPLLELMIENAHELFQASRELIVDLANFWHSLDPVKDSEVKHGQMKKSLSGRTLNTYVCYLDREMSRCDDVASNTQAELQNLFAHIQSLPDTPHNVKLKKQILKTTTTPMSSDKKHNRSKSIGASIKKRLPSLGRSKNRKCEVSISSSSSSEESKASSGLCYKSTDKVAVVHCTGAGHTGSLSLPKRLDFHWLVSTTPMMSDLLQSPVAKPTTQLDRLSRPRHKRSYTAESDTGRPDCTPPKQECKQEPTASPVLACRKENINPQTHQNSPSENILAYKKSSAYSPLESRLRENGSLVSPVVQMKKGSPKPLREKNYICESENEITYLPNMHAACTPTQDSKPLPRLQPRSFRTNGTPIMPRAVLQLASYPALETSI